MTRLVGAILLVAGAAGLGLGAVAQLEGRVRDLRCILAGVEAMRRALLSALPPLEQMLSLAAESTEGGPRSFFQHCADELGSGGQKSFGALWSAALTEVPLRLERADLELLRPLGGVLGRYDGDSQAASLRQTAVHLERQLEDALERRRRLGKVYGTIGISAGLFLAILLI